MKTLYSEEADNILNEAYYQGFQLFYDSNSRLELITYDLTLSDAEKLDRIREELLNTKNLFNDLNSNCSKSLGEYYLIGRIGNQNSV